MEPSATPSTTRRALMRQLLHHKEGMTIDELAASLGISRSAVQQHLALLEREGLVGSAVRRRPMGRPNRIFYLTDAGYESFPRRYDLLSIRTLQAMRDLRGEEELDRLFDAVAARLAGELLPRVQAAPPSGRADAVIALMNELGYDASTCEDGQAIRAVNCIYHHLASGTRAVCRFDVRLLSRLLERDVQHAACMVDGAPHCLFRIMPAPCAGPR